MPSPVKISHNLDLGPELPDEIIDIARKQGEDPDRVCADIQELRDMIYGNFNKNSKINTHIKPQSDTLHIHMTPSALECRW